MTPKLIGLIAIVLGALALVYGGFTYAYPDNVATIGPMNVTVQRHASVFVPPLLGALTLAGGVALLLFAPKQA